MTHPPPLDLLLAALTFLFLPGFACPTSAYREFLAAVHDGAGVAVHPHDPSRGLVAQVTGRSTSEAEARAVASAATAVRANGAPVLLGGHSRGGLVGDLAAATVQPDALVLIDPVSGGGPPWAKPDPLPAIGWTGPTLVLGCGKGGHCAPEGRNHEVFAAALPGCTHAVVDDCGHADVLDGHFRTLGRLVCSRGSHPDRARTELAERASAGMTAPDGTVYADDYMSWEQMQEMQAAGMDIQCHARVHEDLTDMDDERLIWQVLGCREMIESRLGERPRFVAYPSGIYDQRVADFFASDDFWGGMTTHQGSVQRSDDLFELQRLRIRSTTTIDELAELLAWEGE